MNDFHRALNERLRALRLQPPPSPWKHLAGHAVGGLTEVGYAGGTDLLLVVSSQGRGVFDCLSGERVARDRESPDGTDAVWYDPVLLRADGIGPLSGQSIRLSGLHGGGLPHHTSDGWSLEMIAPDWPETSVVLAPPWKSVLIESFAEGCTRVAADTEFRAYGFSETGRSFVIAFSHTLELFSRS